MEGMIMFYRIIIALLLLTAVLYSDDIYLNNGNIIKNVKIINQNEEWTVFQTDQGERKIRTFLIKNIVKTRFNANQKTELLTSRKIEKRQYPGLKLLPVSIIGAGLFVDYIFQINDINDKISSYKKLNGNDPYTEYYIHENINKLKGERTRKIFIAAAVLTATVLNTVLYIKQMEVKAKDNGIQLSLKF